MTDYIAWQGILVDLIFDLVVFYGYNCFFNAFFAGKKPEAAKLIYPLYAVYSALYLVLSYLPNVPSLNICIGFGFLFAITQCYQSTQKNRILAVLILSFSVAMLETLVPSVYSLISSIPVATLLEMPYTLLFLTAVAKLMILVVIKAVQPFMTFNKLTQSVPVSFGFWVRIIIIPTISLFVIHSFYLLSSNSDAPLNQWLVILILGAMLGINLLVYYLYDQILESEKTRMENALLEAQATYYSHVYQQMEENWQELQQIKHDLKYHLVSIASHLGSDSAAKNELFQLMGTMQNISAVIFSGVPAIDAVLNYEVGLADKKNVRLDLKISVGQELSVDERALCIILGNAIENALEACEHLDLKQRTVEVRLTEIQDTLYLHVCNPFVGTILLKDGFPITTKPDMPAHGFGLKSISKLTALHNGSFRITCEDQTFLLEIVFWSVSHQTPKSRILSKQV